MTLETTTWFPLPFSYPASFIGQVVVTFSDVAASIEQVIKITD